METTSERNHINIEDEMRRSYLDYAMSVIIGRALPDIRDGLKPVHRRVLWAMHELGNTYNKAYKKSARIVGDVIGKYHPHGDMPVYDTIVRLAQDFSMRYPLIDGQGNFGSVDGDAAAAMRYTEIRMARLANEILADIEKETVTFQPNYDESLSEPTVLPARVPNLLINGSDGIAVGMATKIPPHNLTEIVDATLALLKDPEIDVEDLTKIVTGPDFPTGGFIYGREEIRKSYVEGRGVLQLRARAGIDRIGRGAQERDAIVITEIPFQVNKARLIERIAELTNEKKIEGISDLRDESDRTGMRIVVELKRDAVPQVVLNKLYKLTPMQSSFGIINLAIVNGQPRVLNLKQMLEAFIEFRREVVRKRTEYELRKAKARAHILEGLTKAIDALDYIVTLIRNSRSVDEARQWLTGPIENHERSENVERRSFRCSAQDLSRQVAESDGKLSRSRRSRPRQFSTCNCDESLLSNVRRSPTNTNRSSSSSRSSKRFSVTRDLCVELFRKSWKRSRKILVMNAGRRLLTKVSSFQLKI